MPYRYNKGYRPNYYKSNTSRYQSNYKNYKTKYKSKYKSNYSKAPTKTYGRSAQSTAITQIPLYTTPTKLVKNQLYYESKRILSGTFSAIPQEFWVANGLYDPRHAALGHQPIGFDQMMIFYEHYAVIRSKLTITFTNYGTDPVKVGVYLSPDTVPLLSDSSIIENGLVKTRTIDDALGNNRTVTMSLQCDVKNYFGKSKYSDILDDEKLTGDIAALPTEGVYFTVFAFNNVNGTNDVNVGYDITISYDSIYFEPRKIPIS